MAILLKVRSCYGNATDVQWIVEQYQHENSEHWNPTPSMPIGHLAALGIRRHYAPPRAVQKQWFDFKKFYCECREKGEGLPVDELVKHKVQVNDVTWEPVEYHDSNNGSHQYLIWRVEDRLPYSFDLDMPVTVRLQTEFSVDLKWSIWTAHRESWEDMGHGLVISSLEHMPEGESLTVKLAAWKEIRYGEVTIQLLKVLDDGVGRWKVSGEMTEGWDEVYDLFCTFGLYDLDEDDHNEKIIEQLGLTHDNCYEPENMDRINARLRELGYEGGANSLQAFTESIPFSHRLYDPGVDHDFDFEFDGTIDELLARIDQEEDTLIETGRQEWEAVESCFREERE